MGRYVERRKKKGGKFYVLIFKLVNVIKNLNEGENMYKNVCCVQLDLNLERLRMAIDDLLIKLAKTFSKPKLQTVFLINNYDMTIAVLKVNYYSFFSFG